MPATTPLGLAGLADLVGRDPGLAANIRPKDITDGVAAADLMNTVITQAISATGVNRDGIIDTADTETVSDYIRSNPALYRDFVDGHGNDEGNAETGYHLVQGDGGAFEFQGRNFVDTIGDAIYHVGFEYRGGRFRNEDGDQNEEVADVAGWLNYFVNGDNRVYGTNSAETLHSGDYSFALAGAADEIFMAGGGNDAIWAGLGNDTIFGDAGNDRAGGGEGRDLLRGGSGNDTLAGDVGRDTLHGGDGSDNLYGQDGNDRAFGQAGNDVLAGGGGNDTLRGNQGNDSVWGDDGNDVLRGNGGNDSLGGGAGQDSINAGNGNDTAYGGDAADDVRGGGGNDQIGGNDGNDTVRGNDGVDTVSGGGGNDRLYGDAGDDTQYGNAGRDTVTGGKGNDTLYGQDDADRLSGQGGRDSLSGGEGTDLLRGGSGADSLYGGNGRDTMIGGTGVDHLYDWEDTDSNDVFVFGTRDTGIGAGRRDVIEGFDSGIDKIDLSAFEGLTLTFGSGFSSGGAAQVLFDAGVVQIDSDGDGTVDAEIEVKWVKSLSEADFIL